MKIPITKMKQLLPTGTRFSAKYIGPFTWARDQSPTRRMVVSNTGEMVSRMLDGDRKDQLVHLTWRGVTAVLEDGVYTLSMNDGKENPVPFVEITLG